MHRVAGQERPQRSTARAAVAFVGTLVVGVAIAGCSGDAPASKVPSSAIGPSGAPSAPAPADAGCPTLEDYAFASLQPSEEPAPPSFDPAAPTATPSSGRLPLGATGILAAPDGSPGALVRVSNARFCERLPDVRPDLYPHGTSTFDASTFLLADVEIEVLESGTIHGFIPTNGPTVASYDGRGRYPAVHAWGMPGENRLTSLEPLAGFTYRGTMVWEIPAGEGRVAVDVQQPGDGGNGSSVTAFSFLVRDGTVGQAAPGTPQPTSDPAAIPTTGIARLGASIILEADRGTMPVVVDGIDQVPRYPGVAPAAAGDVFLELWLRFGPGSGTFAFDPAEWVVVGPTGAALGRLELPEPDTVPSGWPIFLHTLVPDSIPPGRVGQPTYLVVEAQANGRVTLEYRPAGGPALVTWVLRDRGGG